MRERDPSPRRPQQELGQQDGACATDEAAEQDADQSSAGCFSGCPRVQQAEDRKEPQQYDGGESQVLASQTQHQRVFERCPQPDWAGELGVGQHREVARRLAGHGGDQWMQVAQQHPVGEQRRQHEGGGHDGNDYGAP